MEFIATSLKENHLSDHGPLPRSEGVEGNWLHSAKGLPTPKTFRIGIYIALIPILMMFISFTSAMVVRRGLSDDWTPTPPSNIIWVSTLLLLLSSFTIERARQSFKVGKMESLALWLTSTTILGIAFVFGQFAVWGDLVSKGVYLASNPSSSFFYLLTVAHSLHLSGGLLALFYLNYRSYIIKPKTPFTGTGLDVTAIYWHFMDGLWVYVFMLLLFWR